jgi:glycosyltransferase involved in cell wall biosynthesis
VRIAFHSPRTGCLDPAVLGGDPIFVRNLLAALRDRGHVVEVVTRQDVGDLATGSLAPHRVIGEAAAVRRRMRLFSPDAWLTYGASSSAPDLYGGWARAGRYVLFAVGDGRPDTLPRRWRWMFGLAHQFSVARADALLVEVPTRAATLASLGVAPERIHVRPSPPRRWPEIPARWEARRRLGLPKAAPVLLCMGRFPEPISSWPGAKTGMVLSLLEAVAELPPEVMLLVVGDDGDGQAIVAREIARRGLGGRVRLLGVAERLRRLGSLDNEEVKWFYAACDLYVYPHPLDRPWLSVLEAQACGRPVLGLRTPSTELIVDAGKSGLLARDLPEFRRMLAALCGDRARCDAMGRAARDYVQCHHSMDRCVQELESLMCGPRKEAVPSARLPTKPPARSTLSRQDA